MKCIIKYVLGTLAVISSTVFFAQTLTSTPMPCTGISPFLMNVYTGLLEATTCIEDYNNTNQVLEIPGINNVTLKAGDNIHLNGEVHIAAVQSGNFHGLIEKANIDLAWFDPNGTAWQSVPRYEKLELGLNLNAQINEAIKNYVLENGNTPSLNPFNPDDIDVKAEFSYFLDNGNGNGIWLDENTPASVIQSVQNTFGLLFPLKTYGFYYKEFQRDYTNYTWDSQSFELDGANSDYNFRIRFAPPFEGLWKCKITATVNGFGTFTIPDFQFTCTPKIDHGYMEIGENKRYFMRDDAPYFPLGRNLPQPQCREDYITGETFGCELNTNRVPFYESLSWYLAYENRLQDYEGVGGEYFRLLVFPDSYEIEFEKLNNYYNRQRCAWEFDRLLDNIKGLDLLMHFNMQLHTALERPGINNTIHDWVSGPETPVLPGTPPDPYNPGYPRCQDANDVGYCYSHIPTINGPLDFFTDATAKQNYKRRLRYYTSRWGYSTNISIFELFSEINNAGKEGAVEFFTN